MPVSQFGRASAAFLLILAAVSLILLGYRTGVPQSARRVDAAPDTTPASSRVADGAGRAAALLPPARRLALESLSDVAARYGVDGGALRRARGQVEAVRDVRLDPGLGDLAEFDEDEPAAVKLGEQYAANIEGDDEAVVMLAHELTHAAAAGGNLDGLIEAVAAEAGRRSGVFAAEGQKEDLLCEYVSEQALKRFARLRPDGEPLSERVGRALGGGGSDAEDDADEEHLSAGETWRALRALDAELR